VTSTGIERWLPGLRLVRTYQKSWLRNDLPAGLSLAAVAMPIGIAYAQLAGFPPVVGIYSSILPPVAYALFGSSRLFVHHDDAEREYAYDRADKLQQFNKGWEEAVANGWTVVSMKRDWKVIYPFQRSSARNEKRVAGQTERRLVQQILATGME
jgi:hypothetical protein